MNLKRILSLCGILLLAGCSLHRPEPVELGFDLPDEYRRVAAGEPSVAGEFWWQQFGDHRLDQLMTELFAENLGLERAMARLQQARASLRGARSSQLPTVTGSGQASRDRSATDLLTETAQGSVSVAYELDLWRKYASRSTAASLEAEATAADARALFLSLSAQLADLYFLAVEQHAQLELITANQTAFRDTLERVTRRYQAGLTGAVDVYQARQNLLAVDARRPAIEARLAAAEHAIDVLLGDYPGIGSADRIEKLPEAPARFDAGLPANLLLRRPDVQAAFARLQASDARLAAAIADRMPAVNLLGTLGRTSTELITGPLTGDFWSLLAGVALPIMDGGRRRAEVDRQEAVRRETLAGYRQTVLNAFREVEDSLVANRTTEQHITILVDQADAAESSLRLALDNYLNGLSDYLPVLVAQAGQISTQSQLLSARRQLVSDRITLAKALGGHWMEDALTRRMSVEQD